MPSNKHSHTQMCHFYIFSCNAFPIFVFVLVCMMMYAVYDLCLKAKILRAKLRKQGIDGPTPSLVLGNIPDIQEIKSKLSTADTSTYNLIEPLSLDCCTILLPHISHWTKQFGKTFSFALGKLKMMIQEILRLYPGVGFTVREALADVEIGNNVFVPKGVNIWVWPAALHRDPRLWGPDALKFNPERFANGISGACKIPQAYAPFGLGPRTCPGMNLGMMELKVLFSLILAKFSFSLSPNYRHVPKFDVLLEPKYGVNLIVHKL